METLDKPKKRSQGMHWITDNRRLAIYLRDGLACVYCGSSVEEGTKLTLDHILPYSQGGTNETGNLLTCCHKCNSSRGVRSVTVFTAVTAAYLGIAPAQITKHINKCLKRTANVKAAKVIIDRRGSCFAALQAGDFTV